MWALTILGVPCLSYAVYLAVSWYNSNSPHDERSSNQHYQEYYYGRNYYCDEINCHYCDYDVANDNEEVEDKENQVSTNTDNIVCATNDKIVQKNLTSQINRRVQQNAQLSTHYYRVTLQKPLLSRCDDKIVRQNPLLRSQCYFNVSKTVVNFCKLTANSQNYNEIVSLFKATMKNRCKISQIDRVDNPYLYAAYLLKKEQLNRRSPNNWKEPLLFHGTKKKNVKNICIYNFDWRLHGTGTGHKFGQGVSFSPSASYALHYCDRSKKKVMLVCNVLVKYSCIGNKNMVLPDSWCDTSENQNRQVIVKYEDHEFYPAYKISFTE